MTTATLTRAATPSRTEGRYGFRTWPRWNG